VFIFDNVFAVNCHFHSTKSTFWQSYWSFYYHCIIDCIIDYFCTEPLKPLVQHTPL